jgi:DNA-binding GntR family transcriptional regulator
MTAPGTFERVYAAIRKRLREGVYRPGERLEPAILSEELNASVTPVRDALHRLTGERLVEAPRGEGFKVPMMSETMLRQLYAWHLDLLLLAIMKQRAAPVEDEEQFGQSAGTAVSGRERQLALFLTLARSAGNPEHLSALRALSERLEPVQRIEEAFLAGTEAETEEIVRAVRADDRRALRRSLVQYHRRRDQIVPQLLARLLEPAGD